MLLSIVFYLELIKECALNRTDDLQPTGNGFIAAAAAVATMPKHDIGGDGGSERGWREYAAGGGSAVVAITCTFPINKAMFRQQERIIGHKINYIISEKLG